MATSDRPSRRECLGSFSAAALSAVLAPIDAHGQPAGEDHGKINPPIPVPDISLLRHDGGVSSLSALCHRHATAMQVMFTRCTTTCPIQGAVFERVQKLLPDQLARGIQLVSLSVDSENDTPAVLARWLQRFHARPGWVAAAPGLKDVERVRAFAGRGRSASDNHSTQVHMLNREGLLVWRTSELPAAEEIAAILRKI
jgi:protein SCO1/2